VQLLERVHRLHSTVRRLNRHMNLQPRMHLRSSHMHLQGVPVVRSVASRSCMGDQGYRQITPGSQIRMAANFASEGICLIVHRCSGKQPYQWEDQVYTSRICKIHPISLSIVSEHSSNSLQTPVVISLGSFEYYCSNRNALTLYDSVHHQPEVIHH
jgi:hypothetical protein